MGTGGAPPWPGRTLGSVEKDPEAVGLSCRALTAAQLSPVTVTPPCISMGTGSHSAEFLSWSQTGPDSSNTVKIMCLFCLIQGDMIN